MKIGRLNHFVPLVDKDGRATKEFSRLWNDMATALERVVGAAPTAFDPGSITLPDLAQRVEDNENRIAGTGT